MENDATQVILPVLDEHDVIAIEGMLIRTIRAQDQIGRDREQVKVLNERIAKNSKIRSGAFDALQQIYGFVDPPEEDKNRWDLVRQVIGSERYFRAIGLARGETTPALLSQMGDDRPPSPASPGPEAAEGKAVSIREAVLAYLRTMGEKGAKAAQVREHLAFAHGLNVHEKTPGMTLYRLLKDGLVRREGRIWFAEVQDGENENEALDGAERETGANQ